MKIASLDKIIAQVFFHLETCWTFSGTNNLVENRSPVPFMDVWVQDPRVYGLLDKWN